MNGLLLDMDGTLTSFMGMKMYENVTLPRGFQICNQPNTALWSTILCFSTFLIAVLLRKFRQGKFLGKKVSYAPVESKVSRC